MKLNLKNAKLLLSEQISIVAIGPLTNLALAIQSDRTFAENVNEIFIMGGNMFPRHSGSENFPEFNFKMDAEAAHVVMNRTLCPTYIATLELCENNTFIDYVRILLKVNPILGKRGANPS